MDGRTNIMELTTILKALFLAPLSLAAGWVFLILLFLGGDFSKLTAALYKYDQMAAAVKTHLNNQKPDTEKQ